jgi:hypothetical protein
MYKRADLSTRKLIRRLAKKAGMSVQPIKVDEAFEPELFQLKDHLKRNVGLPASLMETLDELRMQAR